MDNSVFVVIIGLAMAAGIIGTVVPLFPGLTLVWAAALVYGLVHGFTTTGIIIFVLITLIAAAGIVSNVLLPSRRAGAAGATQSSIVLGVVGAVIGFFAIPIVGLPLGGALGIYLGEKFRSGNDRAWEATVATLTGIGWSIVAQLVAGLWILFAWLLWVALD